MANAVPANIAPSANIIEMNDMTFIGINFFIDDSYKDN